MTRARRGDDRRPRWCRAHRSGSGRRTRPVVLPHPDRRRRSRSSARSRTRAWPGRAGTGVPARALSRARDEEDASVSRLGCARRRRAEPLHERRTEGRQNCKGGRSGHRREDRASPRHAHDVVGGEDPNGSDREQARHRHRQNRDQLPVRGYHTAHGEEHHEVAGNDSRRPGVGSSARLGATAGVP